MTKANLSQIEALQNNKYLDSKLNMLPSSLRNIYSNIDGKETLVSRELFICDRLVIGIEYSPEGNVACAYTTDKKGNRVNFENQLQENKSIAPQDLISRRLEEVEKTLAREEQSREAAPEEPAKRVVKRRTNTNSLDIYATKQRGGHSA